MSAVVLFLVTLFMQTILCVPVPDSLPGRSKRAARDTRYLFVFGDSYTKVGFQYSGAKPSAQNVIGNPAFPGDTMTGTTTTKGSNWVEILATQYNTSLDLIYDFAEGGAVVDKTWVNYGNADLQKQANTFWTNIAKPESLPFTSDNSVFVFWFGQNDVYRGYQNSDHETLYDNVMSSYFAMVESLYRMGARNYLFLNLGAIMRSYLVQSLPQADQDAISSAISKFDSKLQAGIRSFGTDGDYPGVKYRYLNSKTVFESVLNNYASYGAPDSKCYLAQNPSCLWYDHFHPGQQIHEALAQKVASYKDWPDFFAP